MSFSRITNRGVIGKPIKYSSVSECLPSVYCMDFDGVDDYCQCGDYTKYEVTDAITVEFDMITNNVVDTMTLVGNGKQLSTVPFYWVYWISGKIYWEIGDGSTRAQAKYLTASTDMTIGEWYHVACTYDGAGQWYIYIDGTEVVDYYNAALGNLSTNTYKLTVGRYASSGVYYFDGCIDNLRIWNVVRTPSQIGQYWNKDIETDASGLMGLFRFNEGSGTTNYNLADGVDAETDADLTIYGATFSVKKPR